jgi:hypothetical protein
MKATQMWIQTVSNPDECDSKFSETPNEALFQTHFPVTHLVSTAAAEIAVPFLKARSLGPVSPTLCRIRFVAISLNLAAAFEN